MPALRELQTRLLDSLLSPELEAVVPLVALPEQAALARLQVYRNTVRSNFLDSLRSCYPAILRLVGEDYFRQVARDFQHRHPSRSGDLQDVGASFPDYLAALHGADEFGYLNDVARLEWLIQEALLAADHPVLDLAKMAGVPAAAYDTLRFVLHPTLRLFESRFPTRRIWEANVGSAEPEPIDLGAGSDRLAVLRRRLRLEFHDLNRAEHRFLEELARGTPFAAAVEAAGVEDEFDASAALQRFVALGVIVDCEYQRER